MMDEVTKKRLERLQEELDRMEPMLRTPPAIQRKRAIVDDLRSTLRRADIDNFTRSRIKSLIDQLADEGGYGRREED